MQPPDLSGAEIRPPVRAGKTTIGGGPASGTEPKRNLYDPWVYDQTNFYVRHGIDPLKAAMRARSEYEALFGR